MLSRVIRSLGPSKRKGFGAIEEKKRTNLLFYIPSFHLNHIKCFFFKPRANGSRVCFSLTGIILSVILCGSGSGRSTVKAVYYHPAYLTCMQSTS